ncbi:hypothetical protein MJO28_006156 [Puccinia striiformis f. sp. tritici]|uniref:Uncharacterized protein n=1 Tax=Puccinia striiformis f. sp. tritici TaxID=168172 RepID=A0ACC0EGM9_9BASI|nr:hypothetical protein MJO28_006156 [Puccinia striiformis f. sp. tritici]KAI7957942.1 hypothetical protein MJO29_006159 [Puccinia striiformis f. sp. tritici]
MTWTTLVIVMVQRSIESLESSLSNLINKSLLKFHCMHALRMAHLQISPKISGPISYISPSHSPLLLKMKIVKNGRSAGQNSLCSSSKSFTHLFGWLKSFDSALSYTDSPRYASVSDRPHGKVVLEFKAKILPFNIDLHIRAVETTTREPEMKESKKLFRTTIYQAEIGCQDVKVRAPLTVFRTLRKSAYASDTEPLRNESSGWSNRLWVHNPSNVMRDMLLKYYYSSSQRRAFAYHISARAVQFILDLAEQESSSSSAEAET